MSDIVERLRDDQPGERQAKREARMELGGLLTEAADEVEKLRAVMHDLAAHVWRGDWNKLKPETRAALGEKE